MEGDASFPERLSSREMTYDEALAFINGLEGRGWRLGLDRMRAFVERAGLTSALDDRGYVHVAGTNGKGTTTAFVESILRHQGHRTGAFFSPYVVDYRERIQAEGHLIEPEELVATLERLLPVVEAMSATEYGGVSKFELEAAMGFAYWQARECDWVALEVGLGGRLDATNVVTPRVSAIVSIGLDHTAILGDSLEAIAAEKAGIVKPGIPLVVGDMAPEPLGVIEAIARERGAPLWRFGKEFHLLEERESFRIETPVGTFLGQAPRLGGTMVRHNAAVAVAACAAAGTLPRGADVSQGLATAWLPGRFDWRIIGGRRVLFDGAHNAQAGRLLADALGDRPLRLVSNMLAGHEVAPFYEPFRGRAVAVEVAPIGVPRALSVEDAVGQIEALGIPAHGHRSIYKAVRAALKEDEQVVVTGSNYLVGAALKLFG